MLFGKNNRADSKKEDDILHYDNKSTLWPAQEKASGNELKSFPEKEFSENGFGGSMSVLQKGTVLEGNITTQNAIRIDGKIVGNITCASTVIIGESGVVEGDIKADAMQIAGSLKGSVDIKNEFSVASTASVDGDLVMGSLNISEGAKLCGSIRMKS